MAWRVGVDSGGTFTDVCLFDEDTSRVEVWKVASTPDDPSRGIAQGVSEAIEQVDETPTAICYFGHGTTVATNALIQHRGVKTGLITTDGFRDLLEVGQRSGGPLRPASRQAARTWCRAICVLEVPERVRHDGSVEITLDRLRSRAAVRQLRSAGVEAVAVCFLYGFVRTAHRKPPPASWQKGFPEAFACVSPRVAPEFREFERMSTAVVNAYLGPVMQGYIRRLGDRLAKLGMRATRI